MDKAKIQSILQARFNQNNWKQFLSEVFSNAQLLSVPEILIGINTDVAAQALRLGSVKLNEDGIERHIAVFEITLATGIVLERNRVGLRNLLRKYWRDIDGAFIVYHRSESPSWRFTYVSELAGFSADGEIVKVKTEPKRYTYVVGERESCKTAAERFSMLASKGNKATLNDVKEAFSVEKLSKSFFDEYKEHYQNFVQFFTGKRLVKNEEKQLTKPHAQLAYIFNGNEKDVRDFCKKLLGRIVFLYFIQKKGWLGVPNGSEWGQGDHHFLTNLFLHCRNPQLFYQQYLSKLFFDTLNSQRDGDLIELIEGQFCRIPYLNGGLFEEDDPKHRELIFEANMFKDLFGFFNQYNFTIYEDDPNDHTVAVDPEMLGHIFENLLEDNKDKGAFYTPKEIVHYMCQESLIEYLTTWFEGKGYEVYQETFISIGNAAQTSFISANSGRAGQGVLEIAQTSLLPSKRIDRIIIERLLKNQLTDDDNKVVLENAREFNDALDAVKICDPAIGSGAFPMGLLHEIFTAKQTIYAFIFGNTTSFDAASTKLNIIQNSIYGVDIERGAVDIARLRFWLSLVVDEDKPKALPNLDFKIVVGNSLISKLGGDVIEIDWQIKPHKHGLFGAEEAKNVQEILKQLTELQREFFDPTSRKKDHTLKIRNLKIELLIEQLNLLISSKGIQTKPSGTSQGIVQQINRYFETISWKKWIEDLQALITRPEETLNFFDWKLNFSEVFNTRITENAGFDIVIGNPPYDVYEGKKKNEIADLLTFDIYDKCKGGKINAYELFLAKTDTLVKKNGVNCQIFQNSFLADNSSRGVRKHYIENQAIHFIDSFPERDDPNKRVFESAKISVCILLTKKKILGDYQFELRVHKDRSIKEYYSTTFNKNEIIEFDKVNYVIPSLQNQEKKVFLKYYNSPSLAPYSDYFNCIEGELNMTFHKQYMTSDFSNPLIVKGAQIQRYYVSSKPSQGKIEYADKVNYIKDYGNSKKAHHHKAKRIALQGISGANDKIRLISTIINENVFCANSCNYVIAKEENISISIYSLLGLFNSKITNWIFRKTSTNSNVNCYEVNNLKLPISLVKVNKEMEKIVLNILTLKSQNKETASLEQEIDCLVYYLYELSYEDILVIEPSFYLSELEYKAKKLVIA